MSFPAIELARALQIALSTDINVQALLGEVPRLYDHPPEDPIFPYVTYGPLRSQDKSGDEAELSGHIMTLHIWSRYGGRSETLSIIQALTGAIKSGAFDLGDIHLVRKSIVFTDIMRALDGLTMHGLMRLSFITDNT